MKYKKGLHLYRALSSKDCVQYYIGLSLRLVLRGKKTCSIENKLITALESYCLLTSNVLK